MRKAIFLIIIILFISTPLFAHKVTIFAYREGGEIKTESYFSDGTPAKNAKVEVYDEKDKKILEGKTDKEGNFSFPVPEEGKHLRIVLITSMGHRAETAFELGEEETRKERQINLKGSAELEKIAEEAVEKEIRPLIKLLEKEQMRVRISDIIGGIGYILGIFGIAFFLYNKRKK